MTENKRYSFNWERGHPNFWDNHCDLADCYLTCEDVVNRLNELEEENEQSKMMIATLRNIILENEDLEKENKELKERNNRQAKQLDDLYQLIEQRDWRALSDIIDDFKKAEEQLQSEWKCYE